MLLTSIAAILLAQAQPVLTLEQAYREAQANNLDLKVTHARLAQVDELSAKVWSAYLPQVSVGGNYTLNTADVGFTFPTAPGQPPGPTIQIQKKHAFAAQAQLLQALIVPELWPTIHNASLAEHAAEQITGYTRLEILFATAQLYYATEAFREAIAVQDELLEVNRQHEKDASARFDAGTVTKVAVLRAQIERAKSEQDVLRTRTAYEAARLALATWLNRKPDFDVVRPAEPAAPASLEQLVSVSTEKRLDVQASKTNLEIAEGQKKANYYEYLPTLVGMGRYQVANVTGFTGRNDTYIAALNLNWNLYDGGLREAKIRESRAKVVEYQNTLLSAQNNARKEVETAWLDRDSAVANKVKAEEQARLARENAQLVKNSFDAGVASYLEVEDANSAMHGADLTLISETLSAQLATLKVAKAAGLFDPLK
jgi:outer membrane protein TolC